MDYFPPLDEFFGSPWLSFGSLGLYGFLVFLFRGPLILDRKRKAALSALYFAIGFGILAIILINPIFWGYGSALEIVDARWDGRGITIVDYRETGGDEASDPTPYYRVHLVGEDGVKLHRFLIGWRGQVEWLDDERIVCKVDAEAYASYSRETGARIAYVDAASLSREYPELAIGVQEVRANKEARRIEFLALDGRRWTIDDPASPPKPFARFEREPSSGVRMEDREVYLNNDSANRPIVSLKAARDEPHRTSLYGGRDSGEGQSMLDASFVAVSAPGEWAVVLHWKTIERKSFFLSAYDLRGDYKWSVSQSSLFGREAAGPVLVVPSPDGSRLLVCSGAQAACLDAGNGAALWIITP
jgi:hypothetical protein